MSNHPDGEHIPKLSPDFWRIMIAGYKWLYIGGVCALGGGYAAIVILNLFWPDLRESNTSLAIVFTLAAMLPGWVIVLGKGCRYIYQALQVQGDYRKRHNLREDNVILEFMAAHPIWFGVIVVLVILCIYVASVSLG